MLNECPIIYLMHHLLPTYVIIYFLIFLTFFLLLSFFTDIRVQLNDQLKCLDNRLEVQQGIVNEFQDIFRRKAEIELKYSQELDIQFIFIFP